ncbi:MAG TPA: hypothetical protein VHG51_12575 [Longimicrobiaceae bacterium]|nr:hypothetical protein [Longimicrobiaceae bacterium]
MQLAAVLLVFAGIAALVGGIVAVGRAVERKRAEEMRGAAEALGWSFEAAPPLEVIPGLERFTLFGQGRDRRIRNFMAGSRGDVRAALFDYHFTTGSGKSTAHWRQTVLYLRAEGLALPDFSLRPEHVLHKIGSVFGYQDIDFADRPRFSGACLLRGRDEAAIRAAFGPEVTGFFEAHPGLCADGGGDELLVWRSGKQARRPEVPGLAERGAELLERLRTRVPA